MVNDYLCGMENKVYIYGLMCPQKNIIRYVGKSKKPERRYSEHLSHSKAKRCDNIHLYRWIAKLLRENLKPVLIVLDECDSQNWKEREKQWISDFGLNDLLNMNEGGIEPPNNTGFKWSEEQKKKHPAHLKKGKPQWIDIPHPLLGKEHPAKGQKRSKEFCELMREQRLENNGMRGVKLSEKRRIELREKQSKSVVLLNESGAPQKEYLSAKQATIELNLTAGAVSRVCNGEYKQTKGYFFKWKD